MENQIPSFLHDLLADEYEQDTLETILDGYRKAAKRPITLRANTLKMDSDAVAAELDTHKIGYSRVPWYHDAFVLDGGVDIRRIWDLDIYKSGSIYLQSLSSMLPPLVLSPRPALDILDMCAAPGGKTAQMAALTEGKGRFTACELNGPRAEKLRYNLEKQGAENINVMQTDARKLDEFFRFDQILLDAPCTGTGITYAGDERAAKRITPALLKKVTKSQRALLDRGLTVLKAGGTLVYSTCSILEEENAQQVLAALKSHRDCELVPIMTEKPADAEQLDKVIVLPRAIEETFPLPLLPSSLPGTLTVAPNEHFEGFFVAAIKKRTAR